MELNRVVYTQTESYLSVTGAVCEAAAGVSIITLTIFRQMLISSFDGQTRYFGLPIIHVIFGVFNAFICWCFGQDSEVVFIAFLPTIAFACSPARTFR